MISLSLKSPQGSHTFAPDVLSRSKKLLFDNGSFRNNTYGDRPPPQICESSAMLGKVRRGGGGREIMQIYVVSYWMSDIWKGLLQWNIRIKTK